MYLRSWVGCGTAFLLASASLGCGQPDKEPIDKEPVAEESTGGEDLAPADNEVIIKVNCPPRQANGPDVRVTLRPQVRAVDPKANVYWTRQRVGGGTHSTDFSIQPEDETNWPWTDGAFPWTGTDRIDGTAKGDQQRGVEFKYNITVGCNDDEVMFDPRMIIN